MKRALLYPAAVVSHEVRVDGQRRHQPRLCAALGRLLIASDNLDRVSLGVEFDTKSQVIYVGWNSTTRVKLYISGDI